MYRETHARSVAKAVSWRVMGTVATSLIVFAVTRRLVLSLAVGVFEFVSKIVFFWLHERVWDRLRFGREEVQPVVVWLTGLPASGKSSLSEWVADALRRKGFKVEQLDGEMVRRLFPQTGFTRPERDEHVRRLGFLASKLEQQGVCVVAATVSPYADSRDFVRSVCRNFVEVHVATPLAECERRDPKGSMRRPERGRSATLREWMIPTRPRSPPRSGLTQVRRPSNRQALRFSPLWKPTCGTASVHPIDHEM
jgi:adenylylsulfate kinase